MIIKFKKNDIWKWIYYVDFDWTKEKWKLKSFNNEKKVAFIVFKCNWNRDLDHWQHYTAEGCNYEDLIF
jgi:hypothetical protein